MVGEQVVYYHTGPKEPEDFTIQVSLWLVQPPKGEKGNNSPISVKCKVRWQEKIDSPLEGANQTTQNLNCFDRPNSCNPLYRIAEIKQRANERRNIPFDLAKPIFTYVDRDYYVSRGKCPRHCTSSKQSKLTNIAAAIDRLPVHNLNSNETLSTSASIVHDRISRDGGFKMMYIMAAVDFETEKSKGSMDLDSMKTLFHEQVLCILKWNKGGLLEVSPGFSKDDRVYYDGDSEFFVSPENMEAKRRGHGKKTSFSFTSPQGALYRYSIDLLNMKENNDELEKLELNRVDDEYKLIADRREVALSTAKDHYANVNSVLPTVEHILQIEILSGTDFEPKSANWFRSNKIPIFITYQIVWLNGDWTSEESETFASTFDGRRKCTYGQTQASRPIHIDRGGNTSDILALYVNIVIFLISSFKVGIKQGALFTILMILLYDAVVDTADEVKEMDSPVYHFAHSISLFKTATNDSQPTIFIQVYSKQSENTVSLLGCGSSPLLTSNSCYEINITTCRPLSYEDRSERYVRLRDYYLGCTIDEIRNEKAFYFNTKQNSVTEGSGTIRLRVQNLSRNFCSSVPSEASDESSHIIKESVDEVLSRLRRQKRERAISDALRSSIDSSRLDNLKLSAKTLKVLERAKARKSIGSKG